MASLHTSGTAFLCFTSDNARFCGFLAASHGSSTLQIIGKECSAPCSNVHECCFDTVPTFYELIVKDTTEMELSQDLIINPVMRLGGDNCSLIYDDKLEFSTDLLLDGQKAEEYIEKYFPHNLLNSNCYICIGQMTINWPNDK